MVGLEVLEREAGVAIDELVVELPDAAGVVDAVCRGVRNVPGAGWRRSPALHGLADREDTVLDAATVILQAGHAVGCDDALTGRLIRCSTCPGWPLADDGFTGFVEAHGESATVRWVAAFAEGSRSGADPGPRHDPLWGLRQTVPDTGFTVCGGRPVAIRRRERRELPCSSWWPPVSSWRWAGRVGLRSDTPARTF